MFNKFSSLNIRQLQRGFTLLEVLVTVAIAGIIMTVAVPNLNVFIIQTRVDNGVLELHRLIMSARNAAISTEQNITLCPLNTSQVCTNNWQNTLTTFVDLDGDGIYEPAQAERILQVRDSINTADDIETTVSRITYTATGILAAANAVSFNYCPTGTEVADRAVVIASTGRPSISQDTNNDGIDEDRDGVNISCN